MLKHAYWMRYEANVCEYVLSSCCRCLFQRTYDSYAAVLTAWMWLNFAIANIIQVSIWNSLDAWHKLPAAFSTDIHTRRSSGSSTGARQTEFCFAFFSWLTQTEWEKQRERERRKRRERGHDRFKIVFGSWILQFHSHILPKCHLILMVSLIIPMECAARVIHTHTHAHDALPPRSIAIAATAALHL